MNFTAIDFETANSSRSSICSMGVAIVSKGKIIQTEHILIKPTPNFYDPYNSDLHGITARHTKDKATFKQQWKELKSYFHNQTIIAHNAAFDCSVLRTTLDVSNLDYPDLSYHCTYRLSQEALRLTGYKLNEVSRHFKIKLKHHNAESDAEACALIALNLCEMNKVDSLEELSSKFGFAEGKIICDPRSYRGFSKAKPVINPRGKRMNKLSSRAYNNEKERLRLLYVSNKITIEQYGEVFKKLREENPGHAEIIRNK